MMLPRLVTKQLGSNSVRELAVALTQRYARKIWRAKTPRPKKVNLLYGACCDKITQYKFFEQNEIPSVPFTTSKEVVGQWLADGTVVFARTLISASEGRGIVQIAEPSQIVQAPVYTKYVPKKREFRVHVFKNNVVQILEKKRKVGVYAGESKVRNTVNGYVFCQNTTNLPEGITELALRASKVTQSDFKGVDIGFNEKKNLLFVIECNSAPGITGSNIGKYCDAIVAHCGE